MRETIVLADDMHQVQDHFHTINKEEAIKVGRDSRIDLRFIPASNRAVVEPKTHYDLWGPRFTPKMADQGLELLGGERPQQLRLLTWGMGEGV